MLSSPRELPTISIAGYRVSAGVGGIFAGCSGAPCPLGALQFPQRA